MATTATQKTAAGEAAPPWQGFRTGLWQKRSTFATSSSRTTRRTTATMPSWRRRRRAPRRSGTSSRSSSSRSAEGRARRLPDSQLHHRPCAGLHRPRERNHRRAADRRAAQAGDHAERRLPDGRHRAEDVRLRARSARRRGVHEVPQDPQRRRLRRLHGRRAALPQLSHPHRPARRLRPRPDHRRLPPRRALRRDAPRSSASSRRRPASMPSPRPTRSSAIARS